jgi:hypothetical protein
MKSKDKAQLSLFNSESEPALEKKQENKYQYLIVVSPSDEIKEKVLELKKKLNVLVPISNFNLRSTPHISIIGFSMKEQLKENFWDKFQLFFSKVPRFVVSLNGFEIFCMVKFPIRFSLKLKTKNHLCCCIKSSLNFSILMSVTTCLI